MFSGIGGLDLGVQAALGGDIAWHAEPSPHVAGVLSKHWPRTSNLGDVRTVNRHQVDPVCVLTVDFPCQDLAVNCVPGYPPTADPSGLYSVDGLRRPRHLCQEYRPQPADAVGRECGEHRCCAASAASSRSRRTTARGTRDVVRFSSRPSAVPQR
ncbi:DNA cytosine methyltransferase [Streptomyces chattanoogensis]|uniref:DNA cytosine methyltransferase n=1 Tax=Streptomyces chattanoogensis TaxID=66876 RepID=UPI0036BB3AEC